MCTVCICIICPEEVQADLGFSFRFFSDGLSGLGCQEKVKDHSRKVKKSSGKVKESLITRKPDLGFSFRFLWAIMFLQRKVKKTLRK